MKIHRDIEQGSEQWLDARSQFISASVFGDLLTPTGKPATGAKVENLVNKMIAQRLIGKSTESGYTSAAMERGHEIEPDARSFYQMAKGVEVSECGLVSVGDVSCSPDGLVMDGEKIAKGVEIKCPLAHTQIGYLIKGVLPTQYIPQVQGSMMVCGVDEWDFLAYHPDFEPLLITVKRDDEWIDCFNTVLAPFIKRINDGVQQLTKKVA